LSLICKKQYKLDYIEPTIDTLIKACKQNNRKAQFELYQLYAKAMFNVAHRITQDTFDAEDAMQEGFLKAFQKIESYQGVVSFGSWLKKIIINQSLDLVKKNKAHLITDLNSKLHLVADEKDGNDTDFIVEKTRQVLDTIQSMKESYRMILNLSLIEGYDSEEIVQLLGISPENCRTLLSRAKASLRKKIEKYDTNSLK